MKTEESKWVCTDPDQFQYGRRISTYKFEFKEFDRNTYPDEFKDLRDGKRTFLDTYFIKFIVNLERYSMKEVMSRTESYYDNLDEIAAQYGKDFSWIVAECIFEQDLGLY